jgi:hypothetical protein
VHLLQFNRNCDVEQPTAPLCTMREQTPLEHPSQVHKRAALAGGAFVTSTVADDLAIQAEDCIPERKNYCFRMVTCSGEHIHQPPFAKMGS